MRSIGGLSLFINAFSSKGVCCRCNTVSTVHKIESERRLFSDIKQNPYQSKDGTAYTRHNPADTSHILACNFELSNY